MPLKYSVAGAILLLFIILTLLCIGIPPAGADTRTVAVGIYENAPKVFTAESGKPSGIFIDIIEEIAKIEGWNLRYVPGTWGEGLDRLGKGEIDLMPDVAYTADREKIYSFHKTPVLSSWYQVYAPRGSEIQSLLDLNGKRILVLERSVQQEAFARLSKGFGLESSLIAVPDYKTMFEMVARGEADAAITNRYYGMMHADKFRIKDTAIVFEPSDLFFAAPKHAPQTLLNIIDSHLVDLKNNPGSVYYASLKRWTSEEIKFKLPAWLQILALVLGLGLVISLAGSAVLKYQVNTRTRELEQINREMEQRIADRTMELTKANRKLQELDRLKSMFIASMSHELRTPLNSIIGFTGMTLKGLSGELNDEQKDNLSRVYQSARHLLALITDVIDISKIEAGRIDVFPETFSLKEIVDEAVAAIEPQLRDKRLTLTVIIPEDTEMNTDRKRLLQCLINLLSNGVKFTEKGGITISARQDNTEVQITITDTGIGIAEKDLPKLFEPFERLDTHLRVKAGGTGLGLYLTKKLATDILRGGISVQSKEGHGSTFTVKIPPDLHRAAKSNTMEGNSEDSADYRRPS